MMTNIERAFIRRLSRIPSHGLGLSVDVYSPNLFDLLEALASHGLCFGYLEIFQASQAALAEVRRRLPEELLAYHAEGLWMTQPDWGASDEAIEELSKAASHLATLGSYWINHECATKQMAGWSFGTYVPALFTAASADVTAAHATQLQHSLAASGRFTSGRVPLVLLEIPPLTYFGFGDMPVTEFFSRIAAQTPCGFVLDLGHVWTYYRYSGDWRRRSVAAFLGEFLDAFPLERVVQIHMAGLAVHESATENASEESDGKVPFWIDAHHAPIPGVLSDMLDQVLTHPKLRALKGLALEVDTKSIAQIVHELHQVQQRFGERVSTVCDAVEAAPVARAALDEECVIDSIIVEASADAAGALRHQYENYARVVRGHISASQAGLPSRWLEPGNLEVYRQTYLPHEILHWGGDVRDMFPETCRELLRAGIDVSAFVAFWFREPHPLNQPYDFFLLKVDRFPRFIGEVLPTLFSCAMREAGALRDAYRAACDDVVQHEGAHS